MNKVGISAVLCVVFLLIGSGILAQPKIYSPLSRLGLGDPVHQSFMHSRTLGSLQAAFRNEHFVNPVNPASLSALTATSFEVGADATYTELTSQDSREYFWTGNLEYLALAMPLINPINEALERRETDVSIGLIFGVQPFSRVGYDVTSTEMHPVIGEIERRYTGTGGTYQFYGGVGLSYKSFSIGFRGAYLFGNMENERFVNLPDLESYYYDNFEDDINYKGLLWRLGAQYDWVIERRDPIVEDEQGKPQKVLTMGLYVQPKQSYSTEVTELYERRLIFSSDVRDTLLFNDGLEQSGNMPSMIGAGLNYRDKGKWSIGLDWRMRPWSDYTNEAKPDQLYDTYRISMGASIIPDVNSISNILERTEYRIGFEYGKDPRKFQDEQGRYFRISTGFGMPFVFNRQTTYLNLGFYYGKDGVPNKMDRTQFGIQVGFTLTDNSWFVKRKYR